MIKLFTRSAAENDPFCGVSLGDKVKDTLTGFTGIVTARAEYLTGCNQVYVLPKSEKENEIKGGEWFDMERIEKVADRAVQIKERRTGADIPAPSGSGARAEMSN